jgi:hypothetical protein
MVDVIEAKDTWPTWNFTWEEFKLQLDGRSMMLHHLMLQDVMELLEFT